MMSGNALGFARKVRASSIRILLNSLVAKADYGDLVCTEIGAVDLASRSLLVGRQWEFLAWAIVAARSDPAGTNTGYGDLKRRGDNTFVASTYYANRDSTVADVEQYTFGGERAL